MGIKKYDQAKRRAFFRLIAFTDDISWPLPVGFIIHFIHITYLNPVYQHPVKRGPVADQLGFRPFKEFRILAAVEPFYTYIPVGFHALMVDLDGARGAEHLAEQAVDAALSEDDRVNGQVDCIHRTIVHAESTLRIATLCLVIRHLECKISILRLIYRTIFAKIHAFSIPLKYWQDNLFTPGYPLADLHHFPAKIGCRLTVDLIGMSLGVPG